MTNLPVADGPGRPIPQRPALCTCVRCRPDTDAIDEADVPLIVEQRLRLSLDCLATTRRMTRLVDESTGIPLFSDLRRFAQFVRHVTRAVERHLQAMKAVLPVSATNLAAPDWKGDR